MQNQKGFIGIITIILGFVALVGVGGYSVYKNYSTSFSLPKLAEQSVQNKQQEAHRANNQQSTIQVVDQPQSVGDSQKQAQKQTQVQQPGWLNMLHYSIGEYGVSFDYLASYHVKLLGPNQEQMAMSPYDGTRASYESAIIYYSDGSYFEAGRVDIMPQFNQELSVANYNDNVNLYEKTFCDPLGTSFRKESVSIEYIDGIKTLKVSGHKKGVSMSCYFFKSLSNKLVVFTVSDHKFNEVFSNISLSTEKPISKDVVEKRYSEKYAPDVHWARLTNQGNDNEPVTLSQAVYTPSKAFVTEFDYSFPTSSIATLTVTLDSVPMATIKSKDYIWGVTPDTFRVIMEDPSWLGKKNTVLGFNLYGPDGAQVEITHISMGEYNGF